MRNSLILLFIIYSFPLVAQVSVSQLDASSKDLQKAWVDSTYSSLSLKEKIGQLYMVQVFSNQDDTTMKSILNQIKKKPYRRSHIFSRRPCASSTFEQ